MRISDEIYGELDVQEDLLLDLLTSEAVGRLRGVSQAGASSFVRKGRSITRYEHSVGVMILTRWLGGSTQEQAAGLLQDISHTAFSHTIDYVFGNRKEQFHETIMDTVVMASDLPSVLARHDLNWERLFSPGNLMRVDARAPMLCADRIDYTLRDLTRFGHINQDSAKAFASSLQFIDGVVACGNVMQAARFANWYCHLVENLFMNPLELYVHDEFAMIIRDGMRHGVIHEADLLTTDAAVLVKIKADTELDRRLSEMMNTKEVVEGIGGKCRRVFSKARTIDPPVVVDGTIRPLSQLRPDLMPKWEKILSVSRDGMYVRKVS